MNITGFPLHFSAIFQFRTQIRLQCVEEQETRVAILSSSPMLMDTHFFANFSRSEWASRCRTSIEGLEQEIRPRRNERALSKARHKLLMTYGYKQV